MGKLVAKGEILENVIYKSKNLVIQKLQKGKKSGECYFIGNGHSLDVDANDAITLHEPFMHKFQPKINKDITVYAFYFTYECPGLEESSREVANFVNDMKEDYKKIYLIGHSKCGLCLYNASHYIKKNITLVTISTPFDGTIVVDKKAVEGKLKFKCLRKLYNIIYSDHCVDRDLKHESNFIKNIKPANYVEHINIKSRIKKLSNCRDYRDLFLLFWDRVLEIKGDGIIPYDSQGTNSTKTYDIYCSHANSLKSGLELLERL